MNDSADIRPTRPTDTLAKIVRQQRTPRPKPGLDLTPSSAYEAVTREMVEGVQRELAHLRGRLDALFYVVVGSVLLDMLLRLAGRG